MPLYEYVCDACGHRFEIIQKFSDAAPDACPSCGKGPVVRQFSSPAIQFRGSGFYITDYAQKDRKTGESSSAGSKGDGAKTETAKTDSAKTETTKTDTATKTETTTKADSPASSKSDKA